MAVTCLLQWAWLHDCASQSMQHIPAMQDPCKQKVVATILTLLMHRYYLTIGVPASQGDEPACLPFDLVADAAQRKKVASQGCLPR